MQVCFVSIYGHLIKDVVMETLATTAIEKTFIINPKNDLPAKSPEPLLQLMDLLHVSHGLLLNASRVRLNLMFMIHAAWIPHDDLLWRFISV